MRNVYAIRSHTLNNFEHVQNIIWTLRKENKVHRRMPAHLERTRRIPNVPLTYIRVCERFIYVMHTSCTF